MYKRISIKQSLEQHIDYIEIINDEFKENVKIKYIRDAFFYVFNNFGPDLEITINEINYICKKGFYIIGLGVSPIIINYPFDTKVFIYKINPLSTYKFIRVNLFKFSDKVIDLNDIIKYKLIEFQNNLEKSEDINYRIDTFNNFIYKRIKLPIRIDEEIIDFYNKIIKSHGNFDIMKGAKKYNYSLTSIERIFKKFIGVTPKVFARLKKFENILDLMSHDPNLNFSIISEELGFYDQAHFIKEFKKMTELTPTEFLRKPKIFNNFHSLVL